MNERDKAILNNLTKFRCMSRDQIAKLSFSTLKNPINSCNSVLKRMTRDKYIKASKVYTPYVYFPYESKIKPDSQKIPHFLALVDAYIEIRAVREPKFMTIEPKYNASVEPDMFILLGEQPLFIEIQRSQYTEKVMSEKIQRYEEYYFSNEWQGEAWQKEERKVFPAILIITPTRYAIKSELKIYQAPSITEFFGNMMNKQPTKQQPSNTPKIRSNNTGSIKYRME
ncbi:replication-relaxation family protein [Priestia koreensis]|uniref:replication-relaxation family protein n=1 Tax=Priestia koreensis TaxID=284581 RepID=UPI003CFC296F